MSAGPTVATPAGKVGRYRWRVCAMLLFATTINYVDRQVLGVLAPFLQTEIGWNEIQYGYIVTAFQAAYAIGLLCAGAIIDRLSGEIALARTLERALLVRRMLQAGKREPNIAAIGPAQEALETSLADLTAEIDGLLYELDVREAITSNTVQKLLVRRQQRDLAAPASNAGCPTCRDARATCRRPCRTAGTWRAARGCRCGRRRAFAAAPSRWASGAAPRGPRRARSCGPRRRA